jgi:hypothetical protein
MNHAVEYFHSLVEHKFTKDQYEVSHKDGIYNVKITIDYDEKNPMNYYVCLMDQKRMEDCLHGFIKPENLKLSVVLPIKLVRHNLREHYAKLNKVLRDTTPTDH